MELSEFLSARIAEEEAADRAEWLASLPDVPEAEATAAWDRLFLTAWLRLNIALRQLGWALLGSWGFRDALRKRARQYADHPDYDPAWRP
jgi:hypothetical protein